MKVVEVEECRRIGIECRVVVVGVVETDVVVVLVVVEVSGIVVSAGCSGSSNIVPLEAVVGCSLFHSFSMSDFNL